MPTVIFEGREHPCGQSESVLECLERHGHELPSSCRAGTCQSCLLQATEGQVPVLAQVGLKDTQAKAGYFKACVCRGISELHVQRVGDSGSFVAEVIDIERPSRHVAVLRLERPPGFHYRAGQFIHIESPAGVSRPYSLASVPGVDSFLELHVRHIEGGQVSQWLSRQLEVGDRITLRGPSGDCFYVDSEPERPLLLMGVGTGIAPILGIARDALHRGHRGPVSLYFASVSREGLHCLDALRALERESSNVTCHPVVLQGEVGESLRVGDVRDILLADHRDFEPVRAYLCGDASIVGDVRKRLFVRGVSLKAIHSDPFVAAA